VKTVIGKLFIRLHSYLEKYPVQIFFSLMILSIADRVNTLLRFSFQYIDSDQTVLWNVTKDMANGRWYAPCFYGQAYNPNIEALLAAPLVKTGIDVYIALPIVTSVLTLTPFFILAFFLKKKSGPLAGCWPLLVLLCMPSEYGMLTGMPRGFVTGVFFAVPALCLILINKRRWDFTASILLGIAFYANPNSVLLLPLAIPYVLEAGSFKKRIPAFLAGGILGLIPLALNAWFYKQHPGYIVHPSPAGSFSVEAFGHIIANLESYLKPVSPITGWLMLVFMILITVQLKKSGHKNYFTGAIFMFMLLFISFFSDKVADGRDSIYFSGGRMLLVFPFIALFFTLWTLKSMNKIQVNFLFICIVLTATLKLGFKFAFIGSDAAYEQKSTDYTVVGISTVDALRSECKLLKEFGNPDLIVSSSPNSHDQLVVYGCGCLVENFPPTLLSSYERRKWQRDPVMDKVYKNVLIFGNEKAANDSIDRSQVSILKEDSLKHWILMENNRSTKELLKVMNIKN